MNFPKLLFGKAGVLALCELSFASVEFAWSMALGGVTIRRSPDLVGFTVLSLIAAP